MIKFQWPSFKKWITLSNIKYNDTNNIHCIISYKSNHAINHQSFYLTHFWFKNKFRFLLLLKMKLKSKKEGYHARLHKDEPEHMSYLCAHIDKEREE